MKPIEEFRKKDQAFWATIRFISERLGYSNRKTKELRRYNAKEVIDLFSESGLSTENLINGNKEPSLLLNNILEYLNKRAELLENIVRINLMNRNQAKKLFEKIYKKCKPKCNLPMNKQKGEKKHYAYLTGIVNMLTESTLGNCNFDDNPRGLVIVTKEKKIIKTLSRWMDGAYPNKLNPLAVWEIKEYYGTTTFGSRVADGVYETMLDGEEIRTLFESENIRIKHYLIVDDKFTWWDCGRSYLCKLLDMMHMGYVDEIIFGKEVVETWPEIVKSWSNLPSK